MNKTVKKRSCDVCRRKKIRCDGPDMPNKYCSNCKSYNLDCTYEESAKKRGPPKGYVESLEARLSKAENLLKVLVPDGDFSRELGVDVDPETWSFRRLEPSSMVEPRPLESQEDGAATDVQILSRAFRMETADTKVPSDDEQFLLPESLTVGQLSDNLASLRVGDKLTGRFFGKSSGPMLVQTALNMKTAYTGATKTQGSDWSPPTHKFRPQFWLKNTWAVGQDHIDKDLPAYSFPEPDLLASLVDLYFKRTNTFFPLLHRPTFEQQLNSGKHSQDRMFAAIVLLVAAVGARYSDDPRVFLEQDRNYSAGWQWFNQVSVLRRTILDPPSLLDLQFYALCVLFLISSSAPQASWTISGIGIRLAQEVGAHRKRKEAQTPSVEDEKWKRAFWVLVAVDRVLSSGLGRPCAIQEEDFDLDYPLECDDEWWDHPDPEKAWKQPPGRPCQISAFNSFLRLTRILAQCHRTLYCINKHKVALRNLSDEWEQVVVAELDSILNNWVDSIPHHLLWDPHRADALFFEQSAWLHAMYYHLQILVHRPFISSSKATKNMMWSSFAICTNAARMCARISETLLKRSMNGGPAIQMTVFTSAIVLLLAIWGGKKAGLTTNPHAEMKSVRICMDYLQSQENRWHAAGRFWDILNELATVSDIPLSDAAETPSKKRDRNDNFVHPSTTDVPSAETQTHSYPVEQRRFAGAKRVATHNLASTTSSTHSSPSSRSTQSPTQPLPMYTTDLGILPDDSSANFFFQARDRLLYPPEIDTSVFLGGGPAQPPPVPIPANFHHSLPQKGPPVFVSSAPMPAEQPAPQGSLPVHFFDPNLVSPTHPDLTQTYGPQAGEVPMNTGMAWSNIPPTFDKMDDWAPYLDNLSQDPFQHSQAQHQSLYEQPRGGR